MISESLEMLSDPAHWAFEIVSGGIMFAIGAVWHAAWQRGHDRDVHHNDKDQYEATIISYGNIAPLPDERQAKAWLTGAEMSVLEDEALRRRGLKQIVVHSDMGTRTHVVPIDPIDGDD